MPAIYSFINLKAGQQYPSYPVIPVQNPSQNPATKYGVVSGSSNNKYRVTNVFDLSSITNAVQRLALAICKSTVIAQPQTGSPTLLNLALLPMGSLSLNGVAVKCIVYRGVEKTSLITGSGSSEDVVPKTYYDALNVDWDKSLPGKIRETSTATLKPHMLGMGLSFTATDSLVSSFNKNFDDPLNSSEKIVFRVVQSGEVLGVFNQGNIGIDIILENNHYDVPFSVLSLPINEIDVSTMSGDAKKYEQEKILNYMELGSFYSTYRKYDNVLFRNVYTNSSAIEEPIADFLDSFHSKNKVYLDLRNEHGLSLDYFGDNHSSSGKNFQLKLPGQTIFSDMDYYDNGWPLFELDCTLTGTADSMEKMEIKFLRDYNPVPVLFADGYVLDEQRKGITDNRKFQVDGEHEANMPTSVVANDWSKSFEYYIWVYNNISVCAYLRIYVNRRHVPNYIPNTALKREYYLDNIFGPLKPYVYFKTFGDKTSQWSPVSNRHYIYKNGVDMMCEQGAWVDNNFNLMFYLLPTEINLAKYFVDISNIGIGLSSSEALRTDFTKKNRVKPIRTSVIEGGTTYDLLLQSPAYDFPDGPIMLVLPYGPYEDYYNAYASNAAISKHYPSYFTLRNENRIGITTITPPVNIRYAKFDLCFSAFTSSNSQWNYDTAPPAGKKVRTMDGLMFSEPIAALNLGDVLTTKEISDALINVDDLIKYIRSFETIYLDKDDSFIDFNTRLRVHYYGTKSNLIGGGGPSNIIKNLKEYFKAGIFEDVIRNANYNEILSKDRKIYESDITDDAKDRMFSNANENGIQDNPSPYIVHDGKNIDLGHLLFSFEAIYYAFKANANYDSTNPTSYSTGNITDFYNGDVFPFSSGDTGIGEGFRHFNVYHSYDLAGLMGDLGIGMAEFFYQWVTSKSANKEEPYYPSSQAVTATNKEPLLSEYHQISSPEADLLSDIDGVGLWYAYNRLKHNNTVSDPKALRLSDIIELYYKGMHRPEITVSAASTDYPQHSVTHRWFIFCHFMKFIKPQGSGWQWIPQPSSVTTPSADWMPIRNAWRLRSFFFAQMWSGFKNDIENIGPRLLSPVDYPFGDNIFAFRDWDDQSFWKDEDTLAQYTSTNYPNPILDNTTNTWRTNITWTIKKVFEDWFLDDWVKGELNAEKSNTGLSISF